MRTVSVLAAVAWTAIGSFGDEDVLGARRPKRAGRAIGCPIPDTALSN